jgi:tight adherence protein C
VLIFLIVGLLLVGACATLVGRTIAMPRVRALARVEEIAAYGFHAEAGAADQAGTLTGGLNTIAMGLGTFVGRRTTALSQARLRHELISAGFYRMTPLTLLGYRVLAAIALPVVCAWLITAAHQSGAIVVLLTPLMLGIGWILPLTLIRRRGRARLARIDYELPELVDLLVVTVESGMGFAASIQIAAERFSGPLGDELRLAMQEQAMGLPTDQSLLNMLARADTDGMRSFVRSIRQGESLGVSIGHILRNLAEEMRKRRRAFAEEKAQKAPIKILFPLVGLIFPAIYAILLTPALLTFMSTLGGGS